MNLNTAKKIASTPHEYSMKFVDANNFGIFASAPQACKKFRIACEYLINEFEAAYGLSEGSSDPYIRMVMMQTTRETLFKKTNSNNFLKQSPAERFMTALTKISEEMKENGINGGKDTIFKYVKNYTLETTIYQAYAFLYACTQQDDTLLDVIL